MKFSSKFLALLIVLTSPTACKKAKDLVGGESEPELRIIIDYNGSYSFTSAAHLNLQFSEHWEDADPPPFESMDLPINQVPDRFSVDKTSRPIPDGTLVTASITADETKFVSSNTFAYVSSKTVRIQVREDLGGGYSRDNGGVYHLSKLVPEIDPKTFSFIANSTIYGRDAQHVFRGDKLIPDADPASFKIIDDAYQKDANRIYYDGKPLGGVDVASFEPLEFPPYARDKTNVFYGEIAISGADRASFKALSGVWAKDIASGYRAENKLTYSDGNTFHVLGVNDIYAADAQSIFSQFGKLPVPDISKFRLFTRDIDQNPIMEIFATDETTVFFGGHMIPEADAVTFQVLSLSFGGWQGPQFAAKDKNHHYNGTEITSTP